jgi:hypothetical protein
MRRRGSRTPLPCVLAAAFFLLGPATEAHADAIVRTQAMLASTITELFVEDGRARVELEIGTGDLRGFQNLVPDEILARLGLPPEPWPNRLARFFEEDLVLRADDGPPLAGKLVLLEGRERIRRDDISGEPLPASDDAPPETVLFAQLEYALEGRPATLTIQGPGRAPVSVGFVAYHGGVAVNDFRYLGPTQRLALDWEDPWYSRFESRSLLRQYAAPMSGFLYVEPYEVRKEIIARPLELQRWVDLGLDGRKTIPPEIQPELLRTAAEFLRAHQPVVIDGETPAPELLRIHFLERTLRTSRVIDPPQELDVHSAVLGAIYVYPIPDFPDHVTMEWDLWSERLDRVPAASVDPAGALPTYLEPDWRTLEWQNFLKIPVMPQLEAVAPPPGGLARGLALARWLLLAAMVGALVWAFMSRRRTAVVAAAFAALFTAGAFVGSREAALSQERASAVVAGLLHNVYRAFDFRDEGQIYDVLARSVAGDLLEQIYLETRRGLDLQSQGGARAKVKNVELVALEAEPAEGTAFAARATWHVAGAVGHWGHVHERRNRYRADLLVAPVDGAWKLTRVEILEEERL